MSFFSRIKEGLKKTREAIFGRIDTMLRSFSKIDDELFEELEELLVMGDVGIYTAEKICDELRDRVRKESITDPREIHRLLEDVVREMLAGGQELHISTKPSVILVIGVNGVGKTTTIGKLAARFVRQGKKVTMAAADTFRAAAIDQLEIWAERSGADIIKQSEGSDPAAVVFDSISSAKARGSDIIIVDTAGRLHNKKNLMAELEKINRIIDRELPDADKEVLLVLDATTGQNAVNQTKEFKNAAGITGIVLTKLDGTAKGGVVLAIREELDVPVKFIGIGEQIDDLRPFVPEEFAAALFDSEYVEEDESVQTESEESAPDTEEEHKSATAEIWAMIDAEAEAERLAEAEKIKDHPEETIDQEEQKRIEAEEKEKRQQEIHRRAEERKAKKKFNWTTETNDSAGNDALLESWRNGG